MIPKLYIDKRFTVTGQASQIKLDNYLAMHSYIVSFLKEWSQILPQYANQGAATGAGLQTGDPYITTVTGALAFVL